MIDLTTISSQRKRLSGYVLGHDGTLTTSTKSFFSPRISTMPHSAFVTLFLSTVLFVERDCWEFWTRLSRVKEQLLGCRCLLSISEVRSLRWSRKRLPRSLEITTVFVGESQFTGSGAHLVIHGASQKWRLDLLGDDSFFDIELRDLEDPRRGYTPGMHFQYATTEEQNCNRHW